VLVKIVDAGALALQRFARDRELGIDFRLRRLCSSTHLASLLASHRRYERTETDDRLGEGALVGKSDGQFLDAAHERARFAAVGQIADHV